MVARMIFLTFVVIALAIGGLLLVFKPLIVRYIGILKAKDAIDEQNEAERKHLETLRAQAEEELNNDLGIRKQQSQGTK
jgi:predicted tellurium resistance membrane protein TerC